MEKKTPNIATFDMPHVKHYSFPKSMILNNVNVILINFFSLYSK